MARRKGWLKESSNTLTEDKRKKLIQDNIELDRFIELLLNYKKEKLQNA